MSCEPMPLDDHSGAGESPGTPDRAIHVPAGQDRFTQPLKVGGIPLDCKVSTHDTHGQLYIFEHTNMGKGGPPRHLHHEQDEWFYVIQGEFVFEVGDQQFRLKPGDSLFAPRKVPHVWAQVSDMPGTLLLAVQPAGSLEAFFQEGGQFSHQPTREEVAKLFEAHGMQVVGEPLTV